MRTIEAHGPHAIRPWLKVAIVLAGYAGTFAVAAAAVAARVAATSGPDAQASSGMYACGDSLLFMSVFAVVGVLPTSAAMYFLRPYRLFWTLFASVALTIAATGVAAALVFAVGRHALDPHSLLAEWAGFCVLRILVAPALAIGFFVCFLFSPRPAARWTLFTAAALELLVTVYGAITWFNPLRL